MASICISNGAGSTNCCHYDLIIRTYQGVCTTVCVVTPVHHRYVHLYSALCTVLLKQQATNCQWLQPYKNCIRPLYYMALKRSHTCMCTTHMYTYMIHVP